MKKKKRKGKKYSDSDTAVIFSHVIINTLSFGERLETFPTGMRVTARACHVVAPSNALNGCLAARTFLDTVSAHPLLEQTVPSVLAVRAGETLVVLDVTRRAYASEARWTA